MKPVAFTARCIYQPESSEAFAPASTRLTYKHITSTRMAQMVRLRIARGSCRETAMLGCKMWFRHIYVMRMIKTSQPVQGLALSRYNRMPFNSASTWMSCTCHELSRHTTQSIAKEEYRHYCRVYCPQLSAHVLFWRHITGCDKRRRGQDGPRNIATAFEAATCNTHSRARSFEERTAVLLNIS